MRSKVSSISKLSSVSALRTISVLLAFAAFTVVGCRDGKKASQAKAIIGTDDRTELQDANVLARLGLLNIGDHNCNATLIGPNVVITVVHCVDKADLSDVDGFTFSSASGKIARVEKLISADTKKDLAVYKLDTGKFEYFAPSLKSSVDQAITVAGYDLTSGKWVQSICNIKSKEAAAAAFTYECDTVPGMSGSAVLSNGEVIGLHVAHNSKLNKNLGLDFASLSDPKADLASLPQNSLEAFKMPCICCRGCNVEIPNPLEAAKDAIIGNAAKVNSNILGDQAKAAGWTRATCGAVAAGVIGGTTIAAGTAICAFMTVGAAACPAFLATVSPAVVVATCAQLCTDHRLADPECQ
ncbi:MAG: trypsin-like serine protease [Deltaproteobacteria bacterium]|nr:trypsin-like serine protease [Deltaproteobacteria bacterium]